MDARSIGIFDSGLGGLTTVKEALAKMPGENIVYFGDTGRVPYGSRSRETIIRYVRDDIEFLLEQDVKFIIAACGTASSVALPVIQDEYPIPVIGVVEPACQSAVSATHSGRIGVLGTGATIGSGMYEDAILRMMPTAKVTAKACPLFVPLVENGHTDDEVARLVAEEYLAPLQEAAVDTVILGCTHYPHLTPLLQRLLGPAVTLVNSGAVTVRYALQKLKESQALSNRSKGGESRFFVSDSVENFAHLGSLFLGRPITQIEEVKIGE